MAKRSLKITALVVILATSVLLMVLMAWTGTSRRTPLRTSAESQPQASAGETYSVTMSPMGTVTFTRVPQRIVTQDANYNDLLVALGRQHHLIATGYASNRFEGYYHDLAGADTAVDDKQVSFLSSGSGTLFDKETLYSLRADIHHIDPVQLARSRGWSPADVAEIARNVGPFFANRFSRGNDFAGPEKYEYYTVWELSGKVAEVYRRPQRITELKAVYDQMVANIQAKLPPPGQRPRVGLVMYSQAGFLPYTMAQGFASEQYRAVGAIDAFANVPHLAYRDGGGGGVTRLDLEGMLHIDPDVLITPFAILPGMRSNHDLLLALRADPLAKRLKAFQNNRVYPGGTPLQGPLFLVFQTEMAAKQIYPERFGPFREDLNYPKEEQLFDRARVAAILNDTSEGGRQ